MKTKLIKLTSRSTRDKLYINAMFIESMHRVYGDYTHYGAFQRYNPENEYTEIFVNGNNCKYMVKETPEEIISMLAE